MGAWLAQAHGAECCLHKQSLDWAGNAGGALANGPSVGFLIVQRSLGCGEVALQLVSDEGYGVQGSLGRGAATPFPRLLSKFCHGVARGKPSPSWEPSLQSRWASVTGNWVI